MLHLHLPCLCLFFFFLLKGCGSHISSQQGHDGRVGACQQPCWAVGGAPHSLAHTKKLISFFVRLICPSVRHQCKPNSCFCGIVGVCPAHRSLFVVLGVDGLKPMPATTLCLSLTPPPPAVSHAHDVQTECVALSRTQHKNRYNTQICISTSGLNTPPPPFHFKLPL